MRHAAAVIGTALCLSVQPRYWARPLQNLFARQVLAIGVEPVGFVCGVAAGANLATINLTPRAVRADYPIYKRDRIIMDEKRVLSAIEEAGCELSRVSIAEHLHNDAVVVF